MNSATKDCIGEVVCSVAEIFGFMLTDPAEPDDEAIGEPEEPVDAEVAFEGAADGRLLLHTSLEAAMEMSCNALGHDEADAQQGLDALQELANQCCGQLLTTLAGKEPTFLLGLPVARKAPPGAWGATVQAPDTLCFVMDGSYPLLVRLEVKADENGLVT